MDSWPLADITQSTNYPNYSIFQLSYSSQSLMDHKIAFSEISGEEPWAYILCWSAMTEKCLYTMKGSIIIFICKHFYVAHRNYTAYLAIFKQKKQNKTIEHCLFSRVSIITWSTAGIAFATKERACAEAWLTDESKCCVRPPKVSFLSRVGEQVRRLGGGEAAMCQRARWLGGEQGTKWWSAWGPAYRCH